MERNEAIHRLLEVAKVYEATGNKGWHYDEVTKKIALLKSGASFEIVDVTEDLIREAGKNIARFQKAFCSNYHCKRR